MRRWLLPCLFIVALVACSSEQQIAQFWRPISEPNLLMPLQKAQKKLNFDLSQCKCGIYPENMSHSDIIEFQPDMQRMAETGVVVTPDKNGDCVVQPSLVVSECMRGRGWEETNCSGRMPLAGGGSLCAAYKTNP
jgi:hypothetical protein